MESQGSLDDLLSPPAVSAPATPQPAHTSISETTRAAISKVQSSRIEKATSGMTPPPSTQVPSSNRAKTRTPTPTVSQISTPPPTIEVPSQSQNSRPSTAFTGPMSADEITEASSEELRTKVSELQSALQEAKMSAAHHKLQYKMLAQESTEKIERMAVEARMAQHENDVIHIAEQARAAATPVQPPPLQEGMIPVQKDLYQRMCQDIQQLTDANRQWEREHSAQEKLIGRQETEIASLGDKVTLMRERIRENRDHLNKIRNRNAAPSHLDSTPRSVYATPQRSYGLDALLQASEMTNPEMTRKKGHSRGHSMSSFPATPQRTHKPTTQPLYQTPSGRQPPLKVPSTAPMPRTSAMRTPGDIYTQPVLPVPQRGPPSEGTVSASDREDNDDSEAETDILDPENEVVESQASRAASQMLRSSQEQREMKRDSFKGSGMLGQEGGSGSASGSRGGSSMKQTKLFGAVRKANVEHGVDEQPPAKRVRTGEASPAGMGRVGLGISGVRE